MAGYIHADIAKVIHSPDGAFKIEFLRRNDGLYEYRSWERRREDSCNGRLLLVAARTFWALPDDGRTRTHGAADRALAAGNAYL
jgi:hypothetical protein